MLFLLYIFCCATHSGNVNLSLPWVVSGIIKTSFTTCCFYYFFQQYLEQAQDLVFNENVLLQTLGFDVAIDHPHTHVVRCCHLVRGKCGPGPLFYAAEA